MRCFSCFTGNQKKREEEAERIASAEARYKAIEAAILREGAYKKSVAGRAAEAQMKRMAKQKAHS